MVRLNRVVTEEVQKAKPKKEKLVSKRRGRKASSSSFSSIQELTRIKGIGDETVKDIGLVSKTVEELKSLLLKDSVPLRNDIVNKLKKALLK